MELSSRQTYILRSLLMAEGRSTPESFMDHLSVGKRTVYYELEKINDWLKFYQLGRVAISGHVIRAEIPDTSALEQQLKRADTYFFSVEERRALEIVHIALSSETITIGQLMKLSGVSRNTVLNDIREVRETLDQWGLSLSSAIKSGYQIQGEEMTIRKMLGGQFRILSSPAGQASVYKFLQDSLVQLYDNQIDFGELCRCLIKQYETDIHGDYILADIQLIKMMVQVSWIRSRK